MLTSVGKINKFHTESSVPMATVEIGTKRWNTVFETPAGREATHMKDKTEELKVFKYCMLFHFPCLDKASVKFLRTFWRQLVRVV